MEPKITVVVEIASSKIKGAVGQIGPDGRLAILAVEELPGLNNVRYGRVQNIREVSAAVNEIIRRLENSPGVKPRSIRALAVSIGGRSLTGTPAQASLKLPHECEITDKQVERLICEATHDFVGDRHIEATVPRVFYVNNGVVRNPVGTFGESFRGEFVMITCGKETRQNLDRLKFDTVDADKIIYVIRPTAVADIVLLPEEKELGAAVVDLGAETTTVAVYKEGSLAFLCTVPMGSRLITLDLTMGLNMTEEAAEALKIAFSNGTAAVDTDLAEGYVNSRAGEIVANVLAQLNAAGFMPGGLSKVVLTGGGAHTPAFANQFAAQGKIAVRTAEMPRDITFRVPGRNNADNIDIVALLWAASRRFDESCLSPERAVEEVAATPLFQPAETHAAQTVVDEPEDEPEPEEPVVDYHATVPGRRPTAEYYPSRTVPDESDPDLLSDDDGEATPKKRGLFDRFRRNKTSQRNVAPMPEPEYDDEEEYQPDPDDPFGNPDDGPDTEEEFGETQGSPNIQNMINAIHNGFVKIFSAPSVEEEDEQ